jgi:anaerobic selenocysteine-containing dehydrogenase
VCNKACPVLAEVEEGRLVGVHGDRSNPLYAGYTCAKGRAMPSFVNHGDRLLSSLRRRFDGSFERIAASVAMDEIAQRLTDILAEHGPRAVATYHGTQLQNVPGLALMRAFMDSIGSPMSFSAFTLDKPGRPIAWAMLGHWMAPHQGFHDPRAAMLVGINPFVNGLGGLPLGHPGRWLGESLTSGMDLIVIDPRRSDIAKRATIFLQPRPGHDIPILASMLRVILAEGLHDRAFVSSDVRNVDALQWAVRAFDPTEVAAAAGLEARDLILAARTFAAAGRGFVVAGTGPHMAGHGTLLEYLALCLDTVCGHWLREGEIVRNTAVLGAPSTPKAQAADPSASHGFGERARVRNLGMTVAGMPSATLAEEILLEGEGQVRALISCGGNPLVAFPDERQTADALRRLDLLVQVDPWMSQTASFADYVIAPKMTPEMIGTTAKAESSTRSYATGYGFQDAYAQLSEAVVQPPPGSEVIEDWELFYGLAQRMRLQLNIAPVQGPAIALDMSRPPEPAELVAILYTGSRVPLDEVAKHPHGGFFPSAPPLVVGPKDPGWTSRLDVGNPEMIADLARAAEPSPDDATYPFWLLNRRMMHVVNSSYNERALTGHRSYNPAYLHPDDLDALGLQPGDAVLIRSAHSEVDVIVEADGGLRPGTVSISFGFGHASGGTVQNFGSNVARLLSTLDLPDPYSGQPRMSNVPVQILRAP